MHYRHVEMHAAVAVLQACEGRKKLAARELGISPRCLDMKLEGWNIAHEWRQKPGPRPRNAQSFLRHHSSHVYGGPLPAQRQRDEGTRCEPQEGR